MTDIDRLAGNVREALSMWLRGEPPQTGINMGHAGVAAALDELAALARENERLEQEIDAMDARRADEWQRAEAAEARVSELEAALETAVVELEYVLRGFRAREHAQTAARLGRAALAADRTEERG